MWKKIHTVVPHLLFLVLSLIIVQPSLSGTKGYFPFLFVVFASEAILLLFRKSPVAVNIGIILYCILIFWEIMTAKIGVKNSMLYPAPENVFSVFLGDYQKILQGVFSSLQLLFIGGIPRTVCGLVRPYKRNRSSYRPGHQPHSADYLFSLCCGITADL